LKPYEEWDKPSINWCRISSIHSIRGREYEVVYSDQKGNTYFDPELGTPMHATAGWVIKCNPPCTHG